MARSKGEMKHGADPIRGLGGVGDKHSDAIGVEPAEMGDMGYSKYPVGNQGQPSPAAEEGDVALSIQGRDMVFSSHEKFSNIQDGGVTGNET